MATSIYDTKYLSQEDYDLVQKYKQDYANATTQAEKNAAHAGAEAVRSKYAYSGGGDGSQYITNSKVSGLSPDTYNALNKYASYTPSASVNAAQNYLTQVQSSRPAGYVSRWDTQIMDLYNKITNRDPFKYDLNADMLYQQYKDQYTNLGQLAMMDTMGQAAGLTGGYANTYAQNAGQQAYQAYLQKLNDVVPELYGMARDQYNQETQDLYNQFSMTQSLDDTDYGRYRDTVSDYYNDLNFAASRLDSERSFDLNVFSNAQNYALNIANMESDAASENRQYAYDTAMNMIAAGLTPSADMLAAAGLSAADANSLVNYYKSLQEANAGGGSGGSSGRGSGYNNGGVSKENIKKMQQALGVTDDGLWGNNSKAAAGGLSADEAWAAYLAGALTDDEPDMTDDEPDTIDDIVLYETDDSAVRQDVLNEAIATINGLKRQNASASRILEEIAMMQERKLITGAEAARLQSMNLF
ncbi:MAG: hypothetical protein IKZ82_06150 [Clostridia bacterium]|nr:hypothetical protein [Clostridia bacterium]